MAHLPLHCCDGSQRAWGDEPVRNTQAMLPAPDDEPESDDEADDEPKPKPHDESDDEPDGEPDDDPRTLYFGEDDG